MKKYVGKTGDLESNIIINDNTYLEIWCSEVIWVLQKVIYQKNGIHLTLITSKNFVKKSTT